MYLLSLSLPPSRRLYTTTLTICFAAPKSRVKLGSDSAVEWQKFLMPGSPRSPSTHLEAEKSRAVELRVAVAESFRSEERGGGGEGGSVGGGGGGEGGGEGDGGGGVGGGSKGGGEGGGKGDGGGDGGCSRGTAHQVGRLRALWQRTVWLVGKEL